MGVLGAILLVILIVIVDMVAGATAPKGGGGTRSSLDDVFLQKLEGFPVVAGVWDTNPSEAIEVPNRAANSVNPDTGKTKSSAGLQMNIPINRPVSWPQPSGSVPWFIARRH